MRRFSYTWKSSDGERHIDEMRARRKDDVFTALRDKGIRPIKVEALPRSLWWWAAWCAVVLAISSVGFAAHRWRTAESRSMVDGFKESGEAIIAQFEEQIAALRLDDATARQPIEERLDKAMRTVDVARSRLRLAYRDFGGKAIPARERLYGHFMSVLDEKEEALEAMLDGELDE